MIFILKRIRNVLITILYILIVRSFGLFIYLFRVVIDLIVVIRSSLTKIPIQGDKLNKTIFRVMADDALKFWFNVTNL